MSVETGRVVEGDCLELLPDILDNSVDCIITDPPYFIGYSSSGGERGRQNRANATMLKPLLDNLGEQFERVLTPQGKMFMFTDWRTYPIIYFQLNQFITIHNCIVWDFDWIKAGSHFRFTHEFIVYGAMPDASPPDDRSISDVWRFDPVNYTQARNHPAEKPVEVVQHAIESTTRQGDLVLDPFLGSGTTAVAAKRSGREYLGIEIDKKYVRVAKERVGNAEEQLALGDYA